METMDSFCSPISDARTIGKLKVGCLILLSVFTLWILLLGSGIAQSCGSEVDNFSDPFSDSPSCDGQSPSTGDPGSTQHGESPATSVGNPISLITGNKYQQESDFGIPGSHLQFNRHYNSNNVEYNQGLGFGWHGTYDVRLIKNSMDQLDIVQSNGRRIRFKKTDVSDSEVESYVAKNPSDGYVKETEYSRVWFLDDGRSLEFRGPLISRINFPDHRFLSLYYEAGKLKSVSDETSRTIMFKYEAGNPGLTSFDTVENPRPSGHLSEVILPDGRRVLYDYDRYHNLVRVRYADKSTREYHYEDQDFPNLLTGITDRSSNRYVSWHYDNEGRVESISDADGIQWLQIDIGDIDEQGIGSTVLTNSLDQESVYKWLSKPDEGIHLLLSGEGPGCSSCPVVNRQFKYNALGQVERETDAFGNQFRRLYDDFGRLSAIFETPKGKKEKKTRQYSYEDGSRKPTVISKPSVNPSGIHSKVFRFGPGGEIVLISESGYSPVLESESIVGYEPIERTVGFSYQNGLLTEIDGPRLDVEDVIHIEYDEYNRLSALKRSGMADILFGDYTALGQAQSVTWGDNQEIRYQFSQSGQLAKLVNAFDVVNYHYDPEGRLTSVQSQKTDQIQFAYNTDGSLQSIKDQYEVLMQLQYTSEKLLSQIEITAPDGSSISRYEYNYDSDGRLSKASAQGYNYSQSQVTAAEWMQQYDALGRLQRLEGSGSAGADFNFTGMGKISSVKLPDNSTTQYHYDEGGRSLGLSDARNNRTTTYRDDFDRVVYRDSPDTGIVEFAYDTIGNVVRKQHNGSVIIMEWDSNNRLVNLDSGSDTVRISYQSGSDRIEVIENQRSREEFSYNSAGLITSHVRKIGSKQFMTRYIYNDSLDLVAKILPGGARWIYRYEVDGDDHKSLRQVHYQPRGAAVIEEALTEIRRNRVTGTKEHRSADGRLSVKRFFPDHSLKSLSVEQLMMLEYEQDDYGNIVLIRENGLPQRFEYQDGRLTSADLISGKYLYDYDLVGNRTSTRSDDGGSLYGVGHRYSGEGSGNHLRSTNSLAPDLVKGVVEYDYNSAGSLVATSGGWRYGYDERQQLISVYFEERLIARYDYNGFGERIAKTVFKPGQAPVVTYYFYDNQVLAGEFNMSSGIYRNYIRLDGVVVAMADDDDLYAVHSNHLGAPRLVTDTAGDVKWSAHYEPYGSAHLRVEALTMNLRLPGQHYDVETDLHYNYFRYYDPAMGRYVTGDPLNLSDGSNLYAYANANPIGYVDPLGLYLVAFDGTGNTPSDETNVLMFSNYYRDGLADYHRGVATDGPADYYLMGGPFGLGGRNRIDTAIDNLKVHLQTSSDNVIDIVGFSRGSAQAREFANEIIRRRDRGEFAQTFSIRFMGLFETVATGFPQEGQPNFCEDYDLTIPDEIGHVSQAVAMNEHRILFPLSNITEDTANPVSAPNRVQASFIGAHSDIGGGYKPPSSEYTSGDLSDVAFVWMMEQARLAGVNMDAIRDEDRTVASPVLHDERNTLAQLIDTDRETFTHDGPNPSRPHGFQSLVFGSTGLFPGLDTQTDHPDHHVLSQFILPDGTVDMPGYSAWLQLNYGIDVRY